MTISGSRQVVEILKIIRQICSSHITKGTICQMISNKWCPKVSIQGEYFTRHQQPAWQLVDPLVRQEQSQGHLQLPSTARSPLSNSVEHHEGP